jgi:hypothetical protein
VDEHGFIEAVPPNTPRFNHDHVTLQPLGLLFEPEGEKLITESDITKWTRFRVTVTATLSAFANPIYLLKENGAFLQHNIVLPYPTMSCDTYRTLSIYMKM